MKTSHFNHRPRAVARLAAQLAARGVAIALLGSGAALAQTPSQTPPQAPERPAQAQAQAKPPAKPSTKPQAKAAPEATLGEVVVTATGFAQAQAEAPASVTVVGRRQIEGQRYRDVTDALQDVPGLTVEGGAAGKLESTQIYMRGLGEDYITFLVDGKPLGASTQAYYNGFGSATQVTWLPPASAIERVEVIRGPMSSLYGSNAMGGVINIITKKVASHWSGSATVDGVLHQNGDAGRENQQRFYASGPLGERLGLTVYGSRFHRSEDVIQSGYAGKQRKDLTAKLAWQLDSRQSLGLEASRGLSDNRRTARSGNGDSSMQNQRNYFALTHDINWGQSARTNTYLTREEVKITNNGSRSAYSATFFNNKTVLPLGRHMLSFGGEFKREVTQHDARRFPGSRLTDLSRWQAALFAEDEYFLTERLSAIGGLRFDRNQHYGNKVIPRLYGVYRLSPQWIVKGGVSGGYKAPTLKQADDNIVEIAARGAAWDMGNKNLQPETSTNFEIALDWQGEQGRRAGLALYRTRYKDKIGRTTICTSPANRPNCHYNGETRARINQYVNIDSADLTGLEASLAYPLGPARLSASYTFTDSQIKRGANRGKPLNNLPRHMLNLGADWPLAPGLHLWSKARYKSKSIETGSSQIPAYTLVDVGLGWQLGKTWRLAGGLYNLFDKQITTADFGKTLDGRRLYLSLTADF